MRWAGVKALSCFALTLRRHSVCLDILVLSLVVTVFWCMSSACRIYLHANFLHFPSHQTLTMIHVLCFTRQTRWEWISLRMDLLVSLWLFVRICVCVCVWQSDTHSSKNRGGTEEDSMCVCLSIHSSILICFVQRYLLLQVIEKIPPPVISSPIPPCPQLSEVNHFFFHLSHLSVCCQKRCNYNLTSQISTTISQKARKKDHCCRNIIKHNDYWSFCVYFHIMCLHNEIRINYSLILHQNIK